MKLKFILLKNNIKKLDCYISHIVSYKSVKFINFNHTDRQTPYRIVCFINFFSPRREVACRCC